MANRITHIRKPDVYSTEEHITHIKGNTDSGTNFEFSVPQVIDAIKKNYVFYVQAGNSKAMVTYQRSAAGNEYIKTKPDNTNKDNLLSLPQF